MRDSCGYTGIDAADTTARRYGPLLGDTYQHDRPQLGLRILADLTGPPGPGEPAALSELRARLPLRYAVTADETAVELEFEVVGYRDGDLAADTSVHALSMLPALYGWTDPSSGPPRFGVRVRIATNARHTTDPGAGRPPRPRGAHHLLTSASQNHNLKGEDTMSPDTAPADSSATEAGEPRGAAEHCAAEALFAGARAMYPSLSSRAYHQDEYRRCLGWAHLHLRLAEAITSGAGLVLAHRRLLANPDVRLHDTYVSAETQEWNEYFQNQHKATRRSA